MTFSQAAASSRCTTTVSGLSGAIRILRVSMTEMDVAHSLLVYFLA